MAGANEPHAIVKAVMAIALRMAAQVATAAEAEQEQVPAAAEWRSRHID
jgi:hypothetical protein